MQMFTVTGRGEDVGYASQKTCRAMTRSASLLIVDDDPRVCKLLQRYFQREGYEAHVAGDGREMRQVLADHPDIDLVILDLILPQEDGLDLARQLRNSSDLGIVMLTSRSETVDRIIGLEIGADDYIPKPFDNRELLARIRSVLRRRQVDKGAGKASEIDTDAAAAMSESGGTSAPLPEDLPEVLQTVINSGRRCALFGSWLLDMDAQSLYDQVSGERAALTNAEFRFLSYLLESHRRVLSRDQLLDHVAGRDRHPLDRSIDVLVAKVRHKVEEDPKNPEMIRTVRGVGYMFAGDLTFTGNDAPSGH